MIVCSCRAVSDRAVHAAIDDGAREVEEITEQCGAGSDCFGCWPELERLLDEHDANRRTVAA
ncbi:MAG TPA: (2Fe-2S)-binding protein [Acidimicrobiia bacterium]